MQVVEEGRKADGQKVELKEATETLTCHESVGFLDSKAGMHRMGEEKS